MRTALFVCPRCGCARPLDAACPCVARRGAMASRAFWSFALLVLGAAALVIYVAIEGIPS